MANSGTNSGWLYVLLPLSCKGRSSLYLLGSNQPDKDICAWKEYWPIYVVAALLCAAALLISRWNSPGGCAWAGINKLRGRGMPIPGPRGWPSIGSLMEMSGGHAHRKLAGLARVHEAKKLMAFSLGSTRAVVTSDPDVARELLSSSHFADRPLKQSAQQLMFGRAIGFAPSGDYWRMLRRISVAHLFTPRRIGAHEGGRQADCKTMLCNIRSEYISNGAVRLRPHLQAAALNNIMGSVFGRRFDFSREGEGEEVREMVEEGFRLLGAFNWADHLPYLRILDPLRIHARCARLVPRVRDFVKHIIHEHRKLAGGRDSAESDFVDVLLSLQGHDKLHDDDMVAVLWEMIFRGTDTIALVTEWTMAELVLNQEIQSRVRAEVEQVVKHHGVVGEEEIARLPYLQAVVKESLRMHPPGPLLSWARLCTEDVDIAAANGMRIPAGTTAMVNMWSITHDPDIWDSPNQFRPERFFGEKEMMVELDIRGNDLRLAPFGAGRRVCPGKNLALATVHLWVAKLVYHYTWLPSLQHTVDLTEILKLSSEMATPLTAIPAPTVPF
uniref:CYP78A233 n=1 Tax=Taxus chinensis TaxID=29808 RepID=A0A291FAW2_TAXCH|nr:CYP78A233 [Taxus chinensis]